MVKYFSADWLAQSHQLTAAPAERAAGTDGAQTCRPHVPCMVQPRPPTFGKSYLQPKPRASKPAEDAESSGRLDASPASPLHPAGCASPISEISGYSSGYESEAASSECPSVDEGGEMEMEMEKEGPQRRVRTKFTPEQISKLEKIFNKHKYLDAGERVKTAQRLSLTETQVRTWFQNRRMKMKREVQDYLAPAVAPVMFQHLPPVQYHSVAGQRPRYPAAGPAFYPLPVPPVLFQQQMPHHHHPPLPPPHHRIIHSPHFY